MRRFIKRLFKLIVIFILLIIFCFWQNNDITISKYEYSNNKIPEEFINFKIMQISDLHNKVFGKDQKRLLKHTKKISPDIIVITGDFIDSYDTNINVCIDYIKEAKKIAPIYFVSGNHENWSGVYDDLSSKLRSHGVFVLDNQNIKLQIGDSSINLIGVSDITFFESDYEMYSNNLQELREENQVNILLSHRPELLNIYALSQIDLVFTGHVHGGQFRIPIIGGLIAPNQEKLPKYTSGVHKEENTSMIISRGLGNSYIPIRIFNRPELVVVTLKNDK